MILIFIYSFFTIFLLFLLGYGITVLFIPKQLHPYAFWLSLWIGIVLLIFSLVIFSLAGFSTLQVVVPICITISILNIILFFKRRNYISVNLKEDIIIWLFVIGSLIFNLSPLILKHNKLTSISLGNNDIIMYANVPDYLVSHSIQEGLHSDVSLAINHVLRETYRWGPTLLSSFFLSIFNLKGYQYAYLFQVVIFALTIPMIYVLLKIIYKPTLSGLILSLTLTAFNVNLLYILYHDFSAQVLYWGILMIIYIFIFSYFEILPITTKNNFFNTYDIFIGVILAVLNFSFHEGLIFVILPLFLYLFMMLILRKDFILYLFSVIKIISVFIVLGSSTILNTLKVDIGQAFGKVSSQPIGWEPFRRSILYPNPFEIIGLYSIHSFEALPNILAVIISLIIIGIIIFGLLKSKSQVLLGSFLFVFLLFYIWTSLIRHHFFFYYRAITLTLPLLIILFTIGIVHLFKQRKIIVFIVLILIFLEGFSAIKLNRRLLKEHLFVDASFTTLEKIPFQNNINEPIYSEYRLNNVVTSVWNNNWTEYFLYKDKSPAIPPLTNSQFENSIPDDGKILISKTTSGQLATKVLLKSPIVWENPYYLLGRLCNSSECFLSRPEDLTGVTIGKDSFEDSLLTTGWSTKESTNRWAVGKESTLRLVIKDSGFNKITFEASTLKEPQTVTVYFDGKLLGTKPISTQWSQYTFLIPEGIQRGVHKIRLTYSNTYKPSEVLNGQDTRELAVNFRRIWLQ